MSILRYLFGKRLLILRREKGLRQRDVACDLNICRQAISKYERGEREPDFATLIKMADYYEVSVDFLLGRTKIRPVNHIHPERMEDFMSHIKVAENILEKSQNK